ncbi:ACN9-domain-containing protein [Auricularia subglabra TFB-10046 SS5]|nr:ACN9-domain-containing protein [Auricularia subglabra TFB-10046 SS5]
MSAVTALLPPIPLARAILRAHRRLPLEMRSLGDTYFKAEFRRHREVTNPVHIMGFLAQWKLYLDDLHSFEGGFRGKPLDRTALEKMTPDQVAQLYELMRSTQKIYQ